MKSPTITLGCAIFALAATLATGCVSTSSTRLGSQSYAPTSAANIQVFRTADNVDRPYEEIGLIKASGDDELTDEQQMLEEMKKEAAKLGAHAIILGEIKDPDAADKIVGEVLETGAQRKGEVVAIRFTDEY